MEKTDFREKLKELMREKEISIAKIARQADLNYGTVYYFLNPKPNGKESEMTSANLAKLFDVLNKIN